MKYGLKSKRMRIGNTILWQSSCKKKGNEAQRRRPVYRNASTDFFNMTMNGNYEGNIGTSIFVGNLLVPLTTLLISLSLFSVTVLLKEKKKATGLDNAFKEKAMKACLVSNALHCIQHKTDTIYNSNSTGFYTGMEKVKVRVAVLWMPSCSGLHQL